MKIKTSELEGVMLDYAVAQCELMLGQDYTLAIDTDFDGTKRVNFGGTYPEWSTDWQEAGPIIEREKIGVWWATHYVDDDGVEYGNHWYSEPACTDDNADKPYRVAVGPTLLIAAMRCYVVNNLGDELEVSDEMVS